MGQIVRFKNFADEGTVGQVWVRDDADAVAGGGWAGPPGALIRAPQVLITGTSYAKPAGCRAILVELVGGGGGGGGAGGGVAAQGASGSGGGAGGYARKYYDVSALAGPFTYAVGQGGAGGLATPAAGTAGTASTFTDGTTLVTANGGGAGQLMAVGAGALIARGGRGAAVSTNGNLNTKGNAGAPGIRLSGTIGVGGNGAPGFMGGGGNGSVSTGLDDSPNAPGGGGEGGNVVNGGASVAGGAGTDGAVIIWEFY